MNNAHSSTHRWKNGNQTGTGERVRGALLQGEMPRFDHDAHHTMAGGAAEAAAPMRAGETSARTHAQECMLLRRTVLSLKATHSQEKLDSRHPSCDGVVRARLRQHMLRSW